MEESRLHRYKLIHRLSKIIGMKIQMDGLMMMITRQPQIDIITLDKKLMREYNYEGSMSDFVLLRFGKEAHEILEHLIN